jgi:hypothetical protein
MRYSADGNEEAGGAGGSSGAPPHPAVESTAAVNKAPKKTRCTSFPRPAFPTRMNIFRGKCSPPKLWSSIIHSQPAIAIGELL